MSQIDRSLCRFEVQGRISSMVYSNITNSSLVSTIMNGSHIFDMENSYNFSTQYSTSVESFPHNIISEDPIISSCFLSKDSYMAVGSSTGVISIISRKTRSKVRCYTFQDGSPVLSLKEVPEESSLLLSSSPESVQIINVERSAIQLTLSILKPRIVGALALNSNSFVVANYDGKVMLYDTRSGCDPVSVLTIQDQITSISASPETGSIVAGTVGGRVFIMRCLSSKVREEAFGTGKNRSPIRCNSIKNGKIAAGDISGKITLIDLRENGNPTTYWTAQSLLPQQKIITAAEDNEEEIANSLKKSWSITSCAFGKDTLWSVLTSVDSSVSHVVVIPLSEDEK